MYLLDFKKQNALIKEMEMVQKDTTTDEAYYHHPSTDMMWKSFFPQANHHNRGPKILRTDPVPESLEQWLKRCLTKRQRNDARGLALELSNQPETWNQIVKIAENNYRDYDRKQLKTFFNHLGIKEYVHLFDKLDIQINNLNLNKEKLDKLKRRVKIIQFKRFWTF